MTAALTIPARVTPPCHRHGKAVNIDIFWVSRLNKLGALVRFCASLLRRHPSPVCGHMSWPATFCRLRTPKCTRFSTLSWCSSQDLDNVPLYRPLTCFGPHFQFELLLKVRSVRCAL